MNLSLSRRGDYCVRAALHLARQADAGVPTTKIKEIVAAMDIPASFASQVMADLVKAKIVNSKAGRDGGYWLARSAGQVTLLELVEAGEGTVKAERCALGDGPCRWDTVCPLHTDWQETVAAVRRQLRTVTLDKLVAEDRAIERGRPVPDDPHRKSRAVTLQDRCTVEVGADAAAQALASLSESDIVAAVNPVLSASRTPHGALELAICSQIEGGRVIVLEVVDPTNGLGRIELEPTVHHEDSSRSSLEVKALVRLDSVDVPKLVRQLSVAIARALERL